jgi:hypothetical protein
MSGRRFRVSLYTMIAAGAGASVIGGVPSWMPRNQCSKESRSPGPLRASSGRPERAKGLAAKRWPLTGWTDRVGGIQGDRKWYPSGEMQSVMACDRSGTDRLAAKRFASSLIRGPLQGSFFRMPGVRNLRPHSKRPDQKNGQSIYRVLAVDRAPMPSPLANIRPGTRANDPWSKPVPTRLRLKECPLGNVFPRLPGIALEPLDLTSPITNGRGCGRPHSTDCTDPHRGACDTTLFVDCFVTA